MKAYKGFDRNDEGQLSCRGFVYEIGVLYKHEGEIKVCVSGFHACPDLKDVKTYYRNFDTWHEVELSGKTKFFTDKIVASEIKVVRKLTYLEIYSCDGHGYGHGHGNGYGHGNGNGYGHGRGHGRGDGRGDGNGYGDCHGYGDGHGHGDGNGSGDGCGRGDLYTVLRL
jgi:hypothetical protein